MITTQTTTVNIIQRVKQGEIRAAAVTNEAGAEALRLFGARQRAYLMECYIRPHPPYSWDGLPSRTCSSLRRMGAIARQRATGVPELNGVLVAAGNWRKAQGGVLVRSGPGKDTSTYVPLLVDSEMVDRLDPKKPITIS